MAQTLFSQRVTLGSSRAFGKSAKSNSKQTAMATPGRRPGKQAARASLNSRDFSSDNDAFFINSVLAGGPVVSRHEAGDPFGLLLRQRIVFLGNQVDDFTADAVISQLLLLDAQDPKKDIKLFINSPGGSVTAGMGIYDAMQMCRADVSTVCMGLAASMGAFLLTSGARGKRLSMPNARIMIHQPLGGASGQAVDIEIQAKEIMFHKANLNRLMAFHTGQGVKQIDEDTDRDRYMSPLEAKNYGIIDEIIGGDDAGLKIEGEPKEYLKTKAAYISWGDELDGVNSGSRFTGKTQENEYKFTIYADEDSFCHLSVFNIYDDSVTLGGEVRNLPVKHTVESDSAKRVETCESEFVVKASLFGFFE
eukprot:CAMPEP_0197592120 /NCGR_PEP_ID=MMETSP1326-20131121/14704_1 /TAXON_ID=1155430 /ORGANISM="Genus nov. species nov., Strain RCC2288" /LENGTH=362 /DNA_ID=CAMNT_0043157771 /DNA_START=95 /DNA_END=1184 /DNA_ORIENTATION=+